MRRDTTRSESAALNTGEPINNNDQQTGGEEGSQVGYSQALQLVEKFSILSNYYVINFIS